MLQLKNAELMLNARPEKSIPFISIPLTPIHLSLTHTLSLLNFGDFLKKKNRIFIMNTSCVSTVIFCISCNVDTPCTTSNSYSSNYH